MKLCKDCVHQRYTSCVHPSVVTVSLVDGSKHGIPCSDRRYGYDCGPDAKQWESNVPLKRLAKSGCGEIPWVKIKRVAAFVLPAVVLAIATLAAIVLINNSGAY